MSKTTIALLVILLIFTGLLLYVLSDTNQQHIISTITRQITNKVSAPQTTELTFSTNQQAVQRGQTITTEVLIHNPDPQTNIVQLELAYDPTVLTVDYLTPGSFFSNPDVALQNIDPTTGRISYALRCATPDGTKTPSDCINSSSSSVATITFTVNAYSLKNLTNLTFLPKTVIRTQNGHDILLSTKVMQLTIGKQLYPISSSSAIASPGAMYIQTIPPAR